MNIPKNDKYETYYKNICFKEIIKLFPPNNEPYTDKTDIKNCCEKCIDILINEFENEIKNITTVEECYCFIESYSKLKKNEKNDDSEDSVIFRKLCKHIFGEITKLNLSDKKTINLSDNYISKLYYITKQIDEYVQTYSKNTLEKEKIYQLEIYEKYFEITILNKEYEKKASIINKTISSQTFKGYCVKDIQVLLYGKKLIEAFGEVAESFFEIIFPRYYNPINNLLTTILPYQIIDLTDLITQYPNNNSIKGFTLSKNNVNLKKSIDKPHNINLRTRYRPIIEINVNGKLKYITTPQITKEAISEHVTNQIPFNELPK